MADENRKKGGFATMPREQVVALARRGGKAAHAQGAAYEWDSEAARAAGVKGGKASHAKAKARKAAEEKA
jgi:uncharacterized protein